MIKYKSILFFLSIFFHFSWLCASEDVINKAGLSFWLTKANDDKLCVKVRKNNNTLFERLVTVSENLDLSYEFQDSVLTIEGLSSSKCQLHYTNHAGRSLLCHLKKDGDLKVIDSDRGDDNLSLGFYVQNHFINKADITEKGFYVGSNSFWNKGFIGSNEYELLFNSALNTGTIHGSYNENLYSQQAYDTYAYNQKNNNKETPKSFEFKQNRFQNAGIFISDSVTKFSSGIYEDHGVTDVEAFHFEKRASFEAYEGSLSSIKEMSGNMDHLTTYSGSACDIQRFHHEIKINKSIIHDSYCTASPDISTNATLSRAMAHAEAGMASPHVHHILTQNNSSEVITVPIGVWYVRTTTITYYNGAVVSIHQGQWVYSHTEYKKVVIDKYEEIQNPAPNFLQSQKSLWHLKIRR